MFSTLVAISGSAALAAAVTLHAALLLDWPSRRRRAREKPDRLFS